MNEAHTLRKVLGLAEGLFHKCWGQAKASPEYDKSEWKAFEKAIYKLAEHAKDAPASPVFRLCSVGSGSIMDGDGEVIIDATEGGGNLVLIGDQDDVKAVAPLLFDEVTIAKAKGGS